MKEYEIKGLAASKGIAFGVPFFLSDSKEEIPEFFIEENEIDKEISRFQKALISSRKDVESLQQGLIKEGSFEIVAILDTHLEMLKDPFITSQIEEKIRNMCKNAEAVFLQVIEDYKSRINTMKDTFFQERVRDVTDVSKRVLNHLLSVKKQNIVKVPPHSILIAEELVPSIIAKASPNHIAAFISKYGGISSHASIIARAKGIPYIAGIELNDILKEDPKELIVDGTEGILILNPSLSTKEKYERQKAQSKKYFQMLENQAYLDAETIDGYAVRIFGNLESYDDIELLKKQGASGVGLFRSEYLFLLKNRFPSEEEQFEIYSQIAKSLPDHPVVIRIFDVGGDKHAVDIGDKDFIKREHNPALGCRAIRFLLRYENLLRTQLRALLRSSVNGNIHILIPMVSDISEIQQVKKWIRTIQQELQEQNIPFKEEIPLGCMIEVPSAAIMSDAIAEEVDFLSVGTNDLVQYVIAADRSNPHISYLYSPAHPSILRLLRIIVSAANCHHKKLILCGEMASDPKFIPSLIGLGIRDFSVSARNIPVIKHTIRNLSVVDASHLAEEAFQYTSAEELHEFIQNQS